MTNSTWAGLVRVSSIGGRQAAQFHADEEQVAAIEGYAARHGARVVFMPPELSVSVGRPIEKRPSLLRAIEGVESGEFDGIAVAYLSRLTRSPPAGRSGTGWRPLVVTSTRWQRTLIPAPPAAGSPGTFTWPSP